MKALGRIADSGQGGALTAVERVQQPDMANHDRYLRLYAIYKQAYRDALAHWDALERLSNA
jgi:sugar (pentulose or hexulose) kinase